MVSSLILMSMRILPPLKSGRYRTFRKRSRIRAREKLHHAVSRGVYMRRLPSKHAYPVPLMFSEEPGRRLLGPKTVTLRLKRAWRIAVGAVTLATCRSTPTSTPPRDRAFPAFVEVRRRPSRFAALVVNDYFLATQKPRAKARPSTRRRCPWLLNVLATSHLGHKQRRRPSDSLRRGFRPGRMPFGSRLQHRCCSHH